MMLSKFLDFLQHYYYYYYYSFTLPSRIYTISASLVMYIYFLSLFLFLLWPYWLSSILLPIILASFYDSSLPVALMYSTVSFINLVSPKSLATHIFTVPISFLSFFLC